MTEKVYFKLMKITESINRPVRIAHIIGKLNAAGVEAVVNNYYKNIDHNKYQFDYYIDSDSSCKPPKDLIDMGARYFVIPPYQHLFSHIKTLVRLFKENKYLIVHSGMNTLAPISLFAAWMAGVPIRINHNHSTAGKGEFKRNCLKYCLRPFAKLFANHYCACSKYAGKWLFGKNFFNSGKVTVFNNAVDTSKFAFSKSNRDRLRKELGISNKYVIGHIGRFTKQKNHSFLIDIFEQYYKTNPNAVLLLVGIGELQEEIKDTVKQKKLEDAVIFLGKRSDVDELYSAMDVFLLPSLYEGLPVVGVEAQVSGLPCIFSNEITSEVAITDNVYFLPIDGSVSDWCSQITNFENLDLKRDKLKLKDCSFDIKVQANNLVEYYDECIMKYLEKSQKSSININNRRGGVTLSLSYLDFVNVQSRYCEVA